MIRKPRPILRKKRIQRRQPIIKPPKPPTNDSEPALAAPSKQRSTLKFAAPIKIIVIDPKSEYCKTVWCAIGIALTNVAIGAVLMAVYLYSTKKSDCHAVLCTLGYHFFSAEAILALHYANGWSSPMRTRHRKCAHIFLHVCGIICVLIGSSNVLTNFGMNRKLMRNPHGLTGIMTLMLVILSACFGPFAYYRRRTCVITLHLSLGILTFIMSSFCVCFGLVLNSFKTWAGEMTVYLLTGLIVYYTVFIVTGSFMKCVSRL